VPVAKKVSFHPVVIEIATGGEMAFFWGFRVQANHQNSPVGTLFAELALSVNRLIFNV